jgi:hypothetical protein
MELPTEFDDLLVLEPRDFYDRFIVGIGRRFHDTFVVYDLPALLEAMATDFADDVDDDDDPMTTAIEHFEFNVIGGWVGDTTPGFISHTDTRRFADDHPGIAPAPRSSEQPASRP